jgi:hypothetical protein
VEIGAKIFSAIATFPGSDPVPQGWPGERLRMGSAANVSQQLRCSHLEVQEDNLPRPIQKWLASVKTR